MSEFEVLRLVAASIAMLVVATVVLVAFFRGLSWFDNWRKTKRRLAIMEKSRPARKRRSERPSATESGARLDTREVARRAAHRPIAATKFQSASTKSKNAELNGKQHEEPVESAPRLVSSLKKSRTENTDRLLRESLHNDLTPGHSSETSTVPMVATIATTNRRASIHLMSGEIIPSALVFSVSESKARILEMGLDQRSVAGAIVFEDQDRRVFWVRLENIKMISWSVE